MHGFFIGAIHAFIVPIVRSTGTKEVLVALAHVNAVDQFMCTNMSVATLS